MLSLDSGGYVGKIKVGESGFSFTTLCNHIAAARTLPTATMLCDIFTEEKLTLDAAFSGSCFVQFGDCAEYPMRSVAFGRRRLAHYGVELIPDTYFYSSAGYASLRQAVVLNQLPLWHDRKKAVFWRGNPTFSSKLDDGTPVTSIEQIARVKMCEQLARNPRANVGLSGFWGQSRVREDMQAVLQQRGLLRAKVNMITEAPQFRMTIDIDGVANAWGFFEKLLMGCCILKVESPYEQWFYNKLKPWTHYVPLRGDLSDLNEQIEWCFEHECEAEEIARVGQLVALEETFVSARRAAAETVQSLLIPV